MQRRVVRYRTNGSLRVSRSFLILWPFLCCLVTCGPDSGSSQENMLEASVDVTLCAPDFQSVCHDLAFWFEIKRLVTVGSDAP